MAFVDMTSAVLRVSSPPYSPDVGNEVHAKFTAEATLVMAKATVDGLAAFTM